MGKIQNSRTSNNDLCRFNILVTELHEVLCDLPVQLLVGPALLVPAAHFAAPAPHGAGGALALALQDAADEAVLKEALPR